MFFYFFNFNSVLKGGYFDFSHLVELIKNISH